MWVDANKRLVLSCLEGFDQRPTCGKTARLASTRSELYVAQSNTVWGSSLRARSPVFQPVCSLSDENPFRKPLRAHSGLLLCLNCEAAASVHLGSARHDHVVQTGSLQKGILRFSTWANSHKVAAMNPGTPKKRQLLDGTSPCTAYPVATFIACGFLPCHLAGSRASFDFGSHPGGQISPTWDFLSPSDPQKVTNTPRLW